MQVFQLDFLNPQLYNVHLNYWLFILFNMDEVNFVVYTGYIQEQFTDCI